MQTTRRPPRVDRRRPHCPPHPLPRRAPCPRAFMPFGRRPPVAPASAYMRRRCCRRRCPCRPPPPLSPSSESAALAAAVASLHSAIALCTSWLPCTPATASAEFLDTPAASFRTRAAALAAYTALSGNGPCQAPCSPRLYGGGRRHGEGGDLTSHAGRTAAAAEGAAGAQGAAPRGGPYSRACRAVIAPHTRAGRRRRTRRSCRVCPPS